MNLLTALPVPMRSCARRSTNRIAGREREMPATGRHAGARRLANALPHRSRSGSCGARVRAVQMFVFFRWPPPDSVADWFALCQHNAAVGLIDMDLLIDRRPDPHRGRVPRAVRLPVAHVARVDIDRIAIRSRAVLGMACSRRPGWSGAECFGSRRCTAPSAGSTDVPPLFYQIRAAPSVRARAIHRIAS